MKHTVLSIGQKVLALDSQEPDVNSIEVFKLLLDGDSSSAEVPYDIKFNSYFIHIDSISSRLNFKTTAALKYLVYILTIEEQNSGAALALFAAIKAMSLKNKKAYQSTHDFFEAFWGRTPKMSEVLLLLEDKEVRETLQHVNNWSV